MADREISLEYYNQVAVARGDVAVNPGVGTNVVSPDVGLAFNAFVSELGDNWGDSASFAPILQELQDRSVGGADVIIGGLRVNFQSFGYSNEFDADDFSVSGLSDMLFLHLVRNATQNEGITYEDIVAYPDNYAKVPDILNAFHKLDIGGYTGNENNVKWVTRDGREEYIFGESDDGWELVTDPVNGGSYNYGAADLSDAVFTSSGLLLNGSAYGFDHINLDVTPWERFGNLIEDPTDEGIRDWLGFPPGEEINEIEVPVYSDENGVLRATEIGGVETVFVFTGDSEDNRIFSSQYADMVFGGDGFDTVTFEAYSNGVTVNLLEGVGFDGAASRPNAGLDNVYFDQYERFFNIEAVIGSSGADIIYGDDIANTLSGGGGNDVLRGWRGNDTLEGGLGDDILRGDSGTDTAIFAGNSSQYTGASQADGGIQIINATTNEIDIIYNIERLEFEDTTTDHLLNPIFDGVALLSGLRGDADFGENVLSANDDGSTGEIDITSIFEDGLNFFGREFTSLWVNNNGSVTFNGPRNTFTPTVITDNSDNPEITPFFADVDTSGGATEASPGGNSTGSNLVYYDFDTVNDRFIVTWDDVGYYSSQTDLTNAFQLIMTDRDGGNFDIEFRYENIEWTTGDESGGSGGLGGTPARAGYTASTGEPAAYFELSASGDQDALLALDEVAGNTGQVGRWFFNVRSGDIVSADIPALPDVGMNGWTAGDPHLLTLDGVPYDFHAAGEFVLLRATNGSNFEIQSRMTPVGESVSVNAAIGVRAENGSSIMIDAFDSSPVSVDGTAVEIVNFSFVDVGNDRVYREDNTYTILFAGDDGIVNAGDSRVIIDVHDGRVDLDIRLNTELAGVLEGLLGNANGNPDDDIFLADGTILDRPLIFEDLYGQYRDDWRVTTNEQSLFHYEDSESLDGFYLPDYPGGIVSISDFSTEDVETAQQAVQNAGLSEGSVNHNNAVLDYLLTSDTSFIEAAADVSAVVETAAPEVEVPEDQTLDGDAGDNVIIGAAGDDILRGHAGNDDISGGFGRDNLLDGLGNNNLRGEGGADRLLSLSGLNDLSGGGGSDLVVGGFQADSLNGGAGNDVLRGDAGGFFGGSDVLEGGKDNDILMGGRGADTFVFYSDDGNDVIAEFDVADLGYGPLSGYTATATGTDFQTGVDQVQLVGFTTVDASNIMSSVADGADGAVFSAEGTSVTFHGVTAEQLSADDFIFV